MEYAEVIIAGGGPAGAACAWRISRAGIGSIVLDKKEFPREKTCAGWITPRVLKTLGITPSEYPFGITEFRKFRIGIFGRSMALRTRQYAIRRIEFDNWLHAHLGIATRLHEVRRIVRGGAGFIIDDGFECRYLVGAGGTGCPVYSQLFEKINPRDPGRFIAAMEAEFLYPWSSPECRLWFFEDKLPGYAWYVPKSGGFVNIGIGGVMTGMKARGMNIRKHWDLFLGKLREMSLLSGVEPHPRGHNYYIGGGPERFFAEGAFLTGDAAGLATRDLGEGIGPAIESGILAAESIISGTPLSFKKIPRYSLPSILLSGFRIGR